MKNIVYLSTAVKLMNDDELIEILKVARENNAARNISGVLLYSEGTFLQVLEGNEEDLDSIFGEIQKDRRHKNIIALIDEPISEKNFADWSMGFASVKQDKAEGLIGYLKAYDRVESKGGNSPAVTTLKTFIGSNKLSIIDRCLLTRDRFGAAAHQCVLMHRPCSVFRPSLPLPRQIRF
jgi:hypothetical protein